MFLGKRLNGIALGLGLIGATLSGSALADSFTGKTNAVCAATDVVACTSDFTCLKGDAHTFELPAFMFIDVKKDIIRGADAVTEGITSPILTKEATELSVILQGHENDSGWTVAVNRKTGSFNLSATGPEANFIITGNCVAL